MGGLGVAEGLEGSQVLLEKQVVCLEGSYPLY